MSNCVSVPSTSMKTALVFLCSHTCTSLALINPLKRSDKWSGLQCDCISKSLRARSLTSSGSDDTSNGCTAPSSTSKRALCPRTLSSSSADRSSPVSSCRAAASSTGESGGSRPEYGRAVTLARFCLGAGAPSWNRCLTFAGFCRSSCRAWNCWTFMGSNAKPPVLVVAVAASASAAVATSAACEEPSASAACEPVPGASVACSGCKAFLRTSSTTMPLSK
mmetsp:Transcript_47881/g.113779  ORF Transcript_47881/g.113779 Transcript_47881/m.113779 type:complete len:221 (-) Transcript_47881:769-1431(-)